MQEDNIGDEVGRTCQSSEEHAEVADFYLDSKSQKPGKAFALRGCQVLRWLHWAVGRELAVGITHELALVSVHPPIPKETYGTDHDLHELVLEASAGGTSLREFGDLPMHVNICRLTFGDQPIPDNVGRNWRTLGFGWVYRTADVARMPRPTRLDQGEIDKLATLHELWIEQEDRRFLDSFEEHEKQHGLDLLGKRREPRWINTLGKQGVQGQQLWLEGVDLSGLNLSGRDLEESVLGGVNLDGANLSGSRFVRAVLYGASLRHANLNGASVAKANMDTVQADHVQMIGANLTRCELNDANLRGASLDGATMIRTEMTGADLRGCSIRYAQFYRVFLQNAALGPIDATGATGSFCIAGFSWDTNSVQQTTGSVRWETEGQQQSIDADQLSSALRDSGASVITAVKPERTGDGDQDTRTMSPPARVQQSEIDDLARLHGIWRKSNGKQGRRLWLPDADLSGVDLSGRDLSFSNLLNATLDGANLVESDFSRASLQEATLRRADLTGAMLIRVELAKMQADHVLLAKANLMECELQNADLRGASLDHAVLTRTTLDRADLRGCSLRFARLDRVSMIDAVFGPIDATGATGTIMPGTFIWETDSERQVLDTDRFIAALRTAGAGEITAFASEI